MIYTVIHIRRFQPMFHYIYIVFFFKFHGKSLQGGNVHHPILFWPVPEKRSSNRSPFGAITYLFYHAIVSGSALAIEIEIAKI